MTPNYICTPSSVAVLSASLSDSAHSRASAESEERTAVFRFSFSVLTFSDSLVHLRFYIRAECPSPSSKPLNGQDRPAPTSSRRFNVRKDVSLSRQAER